MKEVVKNGADGVIIWGANSDVDSKVNCERLKSYLKNILSPAIEQVRESLDY